MNTFDNEADEFFRQYPSTGKERRPITPLSSMGMQLRFLELTMLESWIERGLSWHELLEMIEQEQAIEAEETEDDPAMEVILPVDSSVEEQLEVESLVEQGFSWEEGANLLNLRRQIEEHAEMQELPNLLFARWLYQHGYICEDIR